MRVSTPSSCYSVFALALPMWRDCARHSLTLLEFRRHFEGVERRRAGNSPFQTFRTIPWLVRSLLTAANCRQHDKEQEINLGKTEAERADRYDLVEIGK